MHISSTSCSRRRGHESRNFHTFLTPRMPRGPHRRKLVDEYSSYTVVVCFISPSFPLYISQSKFSFCYTLLQQLVHSKLVTIFTRHGGKRSYFYWSGVVYYSVISTHRCVISPAALPQPTEYPLLWSGVRCTVDGQEWCHCLPALRP